MKFKPIYSRYPLYSTLKESQYKDFIDKLHLSRDQISQLYSYLLHDQQELIEKLYKVRHLERLKQDIQEDIDRLRLIMHKENTK